MSVDPDVLWTESFAFPAGGGFYFGAEGFAFPASSVTAAPAADVAHSPADVVAQLLVDLALGIDPTANGDWPVFPSDEPSGPDNVITVYDTAALDDGRAMAGERMEHHGVQVRVRGKDHPTAWGKARAVAAALDAVYLRTVELGGANYLIPALTRSGGVLSLGKDAPKSRRNLFTINAVLPIRAL